MNQLLKKAFVLLLFCSSAMIVARADTLVWNESSWNQGGWSTPLLFQVRILGDGNGLVSANGLTCGDSCELTVDSGTMMELVAQAEQGSHIAHWSNSNCEGISTTCQYRLMATEQLEASFARLSTSQPNPVEIPVYEEGQRGEYAVSAPITLQGIDGPVLVSIENGEISVGCNGNYTAGPVLIYPGDTFCIRHLVTNGRPGTEHRTVINIGGVIIEFVSVVAPSTHRKSFIMLLMPLLEQQKQVEGTAKEPKN